jgi:hypothetical protein
MTTTTELIDFSQVKSLLLQAIQSSGYERDAEKSCHLWLVFRHSSGDRVIVHQKNDYTQFFNPNIPDDKGDTVDFLLHRLNGSVNTGISRKGHLKELQQALQKVSGYAPNLRVTVPAPVPKTATHRYDLRPLNARAIPYSIAKLLLKRGLDHSLFAAPDMASEVGQMYAANGGYVNLFFYWRDTQGNPVGGQYKFLNRETGGTVKAFTTLTSRHSSVWATSTEGKSGLLVCEDPLDALSFRQLFPHQNFALLATGGSITNEQIRIIKGKAMQAQIPIVLANDNDIAGQVSNLKIMDETMHLLRLDAKNQTAHIQVDNKAKIFSCDELTRLNQELAQRNGYQIVIPKSKDWNDDLRNIPQKATPSTALQAVMSHTSIAENEQQHKNSLRI